MLNARLAGKNGRTWLRIDDLDRARFREEYLEDIFRVVGLLGISVTDGPTSPENFHAAWSQEYRMEDYKNAMDQLRGHERLFACPCSRKELAQGRHRYGCLSGKVNPDAQSAAWRINTRELPPVVVPDLIRHKGFTVDLHEAMPDFVVRKKDGRPGYQPACVVDDVLFGVNTVGRGQDLLPSTAAQALLSDFMGFGDLFERVSFLHHPLVTAADGTKISKSAGNAEEPLIGLSAKAADFSGLVNGWLTGV